MSTFSSCVPTYLYATLLAGQYKTPAIYAEVKAYYTNTAPVDAYRGAGRPEASFLLETLFEQAAKEIGGPGRVPPDELHPQGRLPLPDAGGAGVRHRRLRDDARRGDAAHRLQGLPGQEGRGRGPGKKRGIGISCYIEACGIAPSAVVGSWAPASALWESAKVRFSHTGKVQVLTGTHSHGQGHETTFSQLVSEKLGIPFEDVEVIHGDTEKTPVSAWAPTARARSPSAARRSSSPATS
jgi:aerobic carbon-monoxide dehydrogenase large subunit